MVVEAAAPPGERNAGLDGLRAFATLLVVLHHTAITYGAIGGWFYRERPPGSSLTLTFFCTINQAFFMGLFFLLAGYFTPGALARKGGWRFAGERLLRLGVPLAVFGWLIGPMTIALAQTVRGKPFADTLLGLGQRGVFEVGPLWFAEALLILAALLLLWPAAQRLITRPDRADAPFPARRTLWIAALGTGAVAFGLRLIWPVGWSIGGLQLGYFASYVLLFVAGCLAATPRWLEDIPATARAHWRRVAWLALPVLPVLALLGGKVLPPALLGPPEGGWNLPALTYALWEPLIAWGVILGMLARCAQWRVTAPWARALARRAYAIFVIHPPVVVA
ncbi:MAG: acyltransferase family protein, partial [Burkholderiales bacterium]|nr:acyltransferase family protein [Burkholderiales bacterium]